MSGDPKYAAAKREGQLVAMADRVMAGFEHHEALDAAQQTKAEEWHNHRRRPSLPAELGASETRTGLLSMMPKRRSMWPELIAFEEAGADLGRRHTDVEARLRTLEEQRAAAPARDTDAGARWELNGRKGPRPEPSITGIENEIAEAERERSEISRAIDLQLEDKARYITRNRPRLIAVARQQAEAAHTRLRELIDQVDETRQTLNELREAEVFAELFPDDLAGRMPPTHLLGLGRAEPVRQALGFGKHVPGLTAEGVMNLLRVDADMLSNAISNDQQRQLSGQPLDTDAVWEESTVGQERKATALGEAQRLELLEKLRGERAERARCGMAQRSRADLEAAGFPADVIDELFRENSQVPRWEMA